MSEVPLSERERDFFMENLLVRIHYIIVMIRWSGLAPWQSDLLMKSSAARAVALTSSRGGFVLA